MHDKFFFLFLLGILLLNYAMFSGKNISMVMYVKKDFLTIALSTFFIVFFIGKEFEEKKIMYSLLAGNSRTKIVLSMLMVMVFLLEIALFLFPTSQTFLFMKFGFTNMLVIKSIIQLVFMGFYFASLCIFIVTLVKKNGLSVGILILFYLISMLSMNSKIIGLVVMHILPLGISRLLVMNQMNFIVGICIIFLWSIRKR